MSSVTQIKMKSSRGTGNSEVIHNRWETSLDSLRNQAIALKTPGAEVNECNGDVSPIEKRSGRQDSRSQRCFALLGKNEIGFLLPYQTERHQRIHLSAEIS